MAITVKVLQGQVTKLSRENEVLKAQKESLEETNGRQARQLKDLQNRCNSLGENAVQNVTLREEVRRLNLIVNDLHQAINSNVKAAIPNAEKYETEIERLKTVINSMMYNSERDLLTIITNQRNFINGMSAKQGFPNVHTSK